MDWDEALEEMASNLGETHESLKDFLVTYFTVLNPDIFKKLESAASAAEEGMLYGSDEPGPGIQYADSVYKRIKECSSTLKAEVDGQRLVEFHEFTRKGS